MTRAAGVDFVRAATALRRVLARPVHSLVPSGHTLALWLGSVALVATPALAEAASNNRQRPAAAAPNRQSPAASVALGAQIGQRAGSLRDFYATRGNRPLWVNTNGRPNAGATALIQLARDSDLDGVSRGKLKISALESALERAEGGDPADVAKAEIAASRSFYEYVKATRSVKRRGMIYTSASLQPVVPTQQSALSAAADASSLRSYVETMGWLQPLYGQMRSRASTRTLTAAQRNQVVRSLARLRQIPAHPTGRYVLVDAASARLWMYENGRAVDSMRVVVGKPDNQTPMMAGFLRYAIVNPYWNVPVDLVHDRIAYNVNTKGVGYLRSSGYQVLSDWTDNARPIDPSTINWRRVGEGKLDVRVRQLPGGSNFMGDVKFMFPNDHGIYLHDTPDKALMRRDERQLSSGCVRLEDVQRFGRWLMRRSLPQGRTPEQRVELREPVPVYITYLTATPSGQRLAFRNDVYDKDGKSGGRGREARLASGAQRP